MAQSAAQKRAAAVRLAKELFDGGYKKPANLNLADLIAAVGAIDAKMDALPATLNVAQSVKINLVQSLPEPFKSGTNAQEKALALVCWALAEAGLV